MKQADGIAAAANAGDTGVGQATLGGEDLLACLDADDALKIAHQHGVRVRPDHRADDVVGGFHGGDPVPDGLAGGILQGA